VVLPVGRETLGWIREGGRPTRAGALNRFLLRWQSLWFERNRALQRLLPPEPPLRSDPVFILGLWRSGTTYLHDLLGACPAMVSPTTAQCLNPSSFRLRAAPGGGRSVRRPMDALEVNTLSPQEDEFALLALGVPSVYRGFVDPRRLPELSRWLDPQTWTAERPGGWVAQWTEFLAGVSAGRPGRLVLKSPGHTFRVNALAGLFPNASYIWLARDPLDTFLSNRKMWLAMFDCYGLWDCDRSQLDSFLCDAFRQASQCLLRAASLLPRERLAVVTFEQLTGSTVDSLERLNRRLCLGAWDKMSPPLVSAVAAKDGYRPDTYDRSGLPGAVVDAAQGLRAAQLGALASHGI